MDILLESADPRGVDAARLDSWTMHGGLNIHEALSHGVVNQPPVADAGPDQTVTDSDGDGAEMVTLDGTASVDPDDGIVSYEWRENGAVAALGATPTVSLSVGVVTIEPATAPPDTVVITKAAYNSRRGQLTVEAASSGAPDVTLTAFDYTDPLNPVELGSLGYNAKRAKYVAVFSWAVRPSSVSVVSTGGGAATSPVGGK